VCVYGGRCGRGSEGWRAGSTLDGKIKGKQTTQEPVLPETAQHVGFPDEVQYRCLVDAFALVEERGVEAFDRHFAFVPPPQVDVAAADRRRVNNTRES
jgi:hypothetical protein